MKAFISARKRQQQPMMVKILQSLVMLFESPEKKQFRRLKDFISG